MTSSARATPWSVWLLGVGLSGCDGAPPENVTISRADSAGVTIVMNEIIETDRVCEIGPEPTLIIGSNGDRETDQLYRVFGATQLTDGTIAVVNQGSQELRFYDSRGEFLRSAGGPGEGPGEFRDAFLLWRVAGDTLWVGDYAPWRFNVFAPDGNFVRTVGTDPPMYSPSMGVVLDDGRQILADRPSRDRGRAGFEMRTSTLTMHAPNGMLVDTLGVFPNGRWGALEADPRAMGFYPLFESFFRAAGSGNRLALAHGDTSEIRLYDVNESLELTMRVRWQSRDRAVTDAHVAAARDELMAQFADLPADARERMVAPLLDERRPVAERFPALSRVDLGTDGRLWVQEFKRPSAPPGNGWLVFSESGEFECRVRLPEVRQVYEFGSDYVLALGLGDLDTEQVWRLALSAPRAQSMR